MKKIIVAVLGALLGLIQSHAQGFVNLNFESAVIITDQSSPYYPYSVYANYAMPGWTISGCFLGTNDILYNTESTGSTAISLLGTNAGAISGDYSILLYGGLTASAASMVQTGTVPASAVSILFEAEGGGGTLLVSLGDQYLSFSALSTGSNYTLYGATIPAGMAGQSESLEFSALENVTRDNAWEIDNIQFSSTPTPEPRIWALTALGGLLFACRRRKSHAA